MKLLPFPGCCTAGILTGFGGTGTAEYQYRPEKEYTEESMYQEIQQHLQNAHLKRWAMVFGTTNSQQEMANTVLPRIGFQKIQETAKDAHSKFTLLGWVFRLNPSDKVAPLAIPKNPFGKKKEEAVGPMEEVGVQEARNPIRGAFDDLIIRDDIGDRGDPVPAPPQVQDNFDLEAQGYRQGLWRHEGGMTYRMWRKAFERNIYEILPEHVGTTPLPHDWEDLQMEVRLHGMDRFQRDSRIGRDWQWDNIRIPGMGIEGGCITHFRFV